jgi:hypothetical protein
MNWRRTLWLIPVAGIVLAGLAIANSMGLFSASAEYERQAAKLSDQGFPINYEDFERAQSEIPDASNAAPIYLAIHSKLDPATNTVAAKLFRRRAPIASPAEIAQVDADMAKLNKLLDGVDAAATRPNYCAIKYRSFSRLPHFVERALVARTILRAHQRRPAEAFKDVERLRILGKHLSQELYAGGPMDQVHLEATILGLLSAIVRLNRDDPAAIAEAQATLGRLPPYELRKTLFGGPSTMGRQFNALVNPPPALLVASRWYRINSARNAFAARWLRSYSQLFDSIPQTPVRNLEELYRPLDRLAAKEIKESSDSFSQMIWDLIPKWSMLARELREQDARRKLARLGLKLFRDRLKGKLSVDRTTPIWHDPYNARPFAYRPLPNGVIVAKDDDHLIPSTPRKAGWLTLPYGYETAWSTEP